MKIISALEMARIEGLSYAQHGREQETQFMEAAGLAIANFVLNPKWDFGSEKNVFLLCGKGNNAGDAYVAGRYLQEQGFNVTALEVFDSVSMSKLAQANREKLQWVGAKFLHSKEAMEFDFPKTGLILDGLLGTGFHGNVESPILEMIVKANESGLPIFAIDVPSGLDANTGESKKNAVIQAQHTLALECAKTGFFLKDALNYVGHLSILPFGLGKECIEEAHADFFCVQEKRVRKYLPKIERTRHKYQRGYLAILAGSLGMSGAAILASAASLRTGAGIVRLFHPEDIRVELSRAPVELLKHAYKVNKSAMKEMLGSMQKAKAVVMGPGLSTSKDAKTLLKFILPRLECPVLLDADALNLLAEENFELPAKTILTPHHGEMARLLKMKKTPSVSLEFLSQCQRYAEERKVSIVLKGAPTFILRPGKIPYVCAKGDPGMAAAGSGDVLAGMIGALLAQGLGMTHAALLGVYMHGLSGEFAAKEKTSYSVIASDLIAKVPEVYKYFL